MMSLLPPQMAAGMGSLPMPGMGSPPMSMKGPPPMLPMGPMPPGFGPMGGLGLPMPPMGAGMAAKGANGTAANGTAANGMMPALPGMGHTPTLGIDAAAAGVPGVGLSPDAAMMMMMMMGRARGGGPPGMPPMPAQ